MSSEGDWEEFNGGDFSTSRNEDNDVIAMGINWYNSITRREAKINMIANYIESFTDREVDRDKIEEELERRGEL